ncbi:MAG: hypothetical protein ACKOW2_08095 [Sphingobacteriaceae bacterium]
MKAFYFILATSLILVSCGKSKSSAPASPPAQVQLSLPAQNEACTNGTVLSETESTILFLWGTAANAESYEINIKNLTDNTITIRTSTANSAEITLKRNTPYAWYVVSKSTKTTATAQSDTWKFYNSGPGTVSYAPFPADILSPLMNQTITANAGKITLQWKGADADNDLLNYDIYLSTSNNLALLKAAHTSMSLTDVAVTVGSSYYWKVISRDAKGNTSDTGLYRFTVN